MAKAKRTPAAGEKPPLPALDPLHVALEDARNFREGNQKLARAVEVLRETLQTITVAEWDHTQGRAVTPTELRQLAVQGLDAYSQLTGQSWRRNPIVHTRAGDRHIPANLED